MKIKIKMKSISPFFRFNRMPLTLVLSALLLSACGGSGKAKLQLAPSSSSALHESSFEAESIGAMNNSFPDEGTAIAPTVFKMKLIQAYLVEDVDPNTQNNIGQVSRIWVNSSCPSDNGCTDADVGFFDFLDPAAANAELNSQAREIPTGTYRYVRIEFCQGGASGPNVQYAAAGGSLIEATYGGCGQTSAALSTPVEINNGSTVTIALDYDLNSAPLYSMPGSNTCTATSPCLGGINLNPRIAQ